MRVRPDGEAQRLKRTSVGDRLRPERPEGQRERLARLETVT